MADLLVDPVVDCLESSCDKVGAVRQNCVKGVTSGRLDLLAAADRDSMLGGWFSWWEVLPVTVAGLAIGDSERARGR